LLRRTRIDHLEVSGLKLDVVRRPDGTFNLPPSSEGGTGAGISRLDFGRLILDAASVTYRDIAAGLVAEARGMTFRLEPRADGAVTGRVVARGLSVRTSQAVSEGALDGTLVYDGTSLSLTPVVYASPQGRLAIEGRLDTLWLQPTSSIEVAGDLVLSELFAALRVEPPAQGTLAVRGAIEGPLTAPVASISIDAAPVSWRHITVSRLLLGGTITPDAARIDRATIDLDDGTATARGRLVFETGRMDAQVEWRGLSFAALVGSVAPVSIGSRLNGSADAKWDVPQGWRGLQVTATVRNEATGSRAKAIRVAGHASMEVVNGAWKIHHQHELSGAVRIVGDLAGRLDAEDLAKSTVQGTYTVATDDPPGAARFLRALGMTLPDSVEPRAGRFDARLRVAGTLAMPRLTGTATVDDLRFAHGGSLRIDSALAVDRDRLRVEEARASLGSHRATGAGSLDFRSLALEGTASFELIDLATLAETAVSDWWPSGNLAGRFDLAGTGSNPRVRGTITGRDLFVGDQRIGNLSAQIAYADGTISASEVEVRQEPGGRLTAVARYTPSTGDYTLGALAEAIAVKSVDASESWPLAAVLDGGFEGRGTLDHPAGAGHISLSRLAWGDVAIGQAQADITISDKGAEIEARLPALAASISAAVQLRAPYSFSLAATAQETDLASVFARTGRAERPTLAPREGRMTARLSATGTLQDLADARAEADLQQLDIRSGDAQLQLARPASFLYDGARLAIRNFHLQTGATSLDISGEVGRLSPARSLEFSLSGALEDLRHWLTIAGVSSDVAVSGAVTASLSATGALDQPNLTGRIGVQDASVAWPGAPAVTGGLVEAKLDDGVVDIPRMSARWSGATASFRMGMPLALLAEWLPAAVVAGLPQGRRSARLVGRIDGISQALPGPPGGEPFASAITGQSSLPLGLSAEAPSLAAVAAYTFALDRLVCRRSPDRRRPGPGQYLGADVTVPFQPDWVSSACMLVRRSALDDIGLMDESLFCYMDDVDLCQRARDRGWAVWYEPGALAVHLMGGASATARGASSPAALDSFARYFERDHGRASTEAMRCLQLAGFAGRSVAYGVASLAGQGAARRSRARAHWTHLRLVLTRPQPSHQGVN
jgi:hypothetical protein